MQLHYGDTTITLDPTRQAVLGRSTQCDVVVDEHDTLISRQAGIIAFEHDSWTVQNTGRRTFMLVEPSGELELSPSTSSKRRIVHHHTWLRFPGAKDYAVVLTIPSGELPTSEEPLRLTDISETVDEGQVVFTANERRSLEAIYQGYLQLPPHYTRRPHSFRSVSVRLGVEEGKVKADHRRAVERVIAAGGPSDAHSNRDALVAWLLSRGLLRFESIAPTDSTAS